MKKLLASPAFLICLVALLAAIITVPKTMLVIGIILIGGLTYLLVIFYGTFGILFLHVGCSLLVGRISRSGIAYGIALILFLYPSGWLLSRLWNIPFF